MTEKNMTARVQVLRDQAREYHRRGDTVLRTQVEETIRQIAPRAYADKVIDTMYDDIQR